MTKNKEQWDFVGTFREGSNHTMYKNPLYAKYVCPHTEEIKLVKLDCGEV